MDMQISCSLPVAILLIATNSAMASQALPLIPGRYSKDSCARPDAESTRYFKGSNTSTSNENCSIIVKKVDGTAYNVHLLCRYKQASPAEADAVLKVESRTSVTWINECMAVRYLFCGP